MILITSLIFVISTFVYAFVSIFLLSDAAENYQLTTQDPATSCMEWMINFYDLIMADLVLILLMIFFIVFWLVVKPLWDMWAMVGRIANTYFSHSHSLEFVWTVGPALILINIALPSFSLLYSLADKRNPIITIKVIGHQWYWSYEYLDMSSKSHAFDSYMTPTSDLVGGELRLLTTDTQLVLPSKTPIKLLITSADVLHSWAVPSFGIKVDACPGRLNEIFLYIKREGLFMGQCSEICGVNHGFMPIMVKVIPVGSWLDNASEFIRLTAEEMEVARVAVSTFREATNKFETMINYWSGKTGVTLLTAVALTNEFIKLSDTINADCKIQAPQTATPSVESRPSEFSRFLNFMWNFPRLIFDSFIFWPIPDKAPDYTPQMQELLDRTTRTQNIIRKTSTKWTPVKPPVTFKPEKVQIKSLFEYYVETTPTHGSVSKSFMKQYTELFPREDVTKYCKPPKITVSPSVLDSSRKK